MQTTRSGLCSRFLGIASLAAIFAASMLAQPVLRSASNAASYAASPGGVNEIAQGSMFVMFGNGLGPEAIQVVNSFPLPTSGGLAGTSVQITVGTTTVDCIMIYSLATQVAAVVPSRTPIGDGQIVLRFNGQASAPLRVRVVARAFGTFAINQQGSGPGVIQNVLSETNRPVNGVQRAARPGSVVILWGTGLGPVQGDEAAGALPGDLTAVNVEVFVAGRAANVIYRGRSGCCVGIDQIVFEAPSVTGCYLPVVVKIGNSVSNYTTMAVGTQDECTEAGQSLSGGVLSGGEITFSCITLDRYCQALDLPVPIPGLDTCSEQAATSFGRANIDQLDLSAFYSSQVAGSCHVVTLVGDPEKTTTPYPPTNLDAGTITLTGPKGVRTLPRTSSGYDGRLPDGFLVEGTYTVEGSGGSGVDSIGAFRVSLVIPPTLTWTNKSAVQTIDRVRGQEITWTGGDPNSRVQINGIGFSGTENSAVVTLFFCTEQNAARRFVIPPQVLLAVPAAPPELPFNGFLSVGDATGPIPFTAPRLNTGNASTQFSNAKNVRFQ